MWASVAVEHRPELPHGSGVFPDQRWVLCPCISRWTQPLDHQGSPIQEFYNSRFLVAQMVKRLPTMRETWVWSLGREDPQEKEMATHISPLAWKIRWMEEPGRLQSTEFQRVRHDWATSLSFFLHDLLMHKIEIDKILQIICKTLYLCFI